MKERAAIQTRMVARCDVNQGNVRLSRSALINGIRKPIIVRTLLELKHIAPFLFGSGSRESLPSADDRRDESIEVF